MADIFDVLADGTRREILRQLLETRGELAVGDLVSELGVAQPTVSKHLKVLREHGLVGVREEGQHRYYHLDASPLEEIEVWLEPFTDFTVATDENGATTVYAAWAGAEVGDRIGRTAAQTANAARVAFETAQEKIEGARQRVTERLPKLRKGER
ncbi:helix-turn-helix transcriptional regulator [Homoserinibacter sp. GY 40078]|uniref:ArsR/SmtB family transcription factor n=1 Tax=Homoserinibacter sp. GY 40078 TaxID=2603275 RepID=UPI0011CB3868|nr:metalloregulator ArsR/SmtB family transcription factor [Homoserinibacter sp. GY 40078]TXK18604.1 winged helix-turn-helix transcriptional regulator [Homoserinibacter sp. GY 40078]